MPTEEPQRVIAHKNFPARLPLWQTLVAWLLLDRLQPPGWVWGAVGLFFVFAWAAFIWGVRNQVSTDLFENHRK